jgi:hypothetical protein
MSIYSQFFVPKTKFHVEDIPDLSGKIMIVTGGYSGTGWETARVCSFAHSFFLALS